MLADCWMTSAWGRIISAQERVADYVLDYVKRQEHKGILSTDSAATRKCVFESDVFAALCELRDELLVQGRYIFFESACRNKEARQAIYSLASRKTESRVRKSVREKLKRERGI